MDVRRSRDIDTPIEELIEKASKGDKDAFGVIFKKYYSRIHRYLTHYLMDHGIAEDAAVEVFIQAYRNLQGYDERGKFTGWLYKIATNCARKAYNSRKKERAMLTSMDRPVDEETGATLHSMIGDDSYRPDGLVEKEDLKEYLYELIRRLDKKYGEALLLCDVQGLSYAEASEVLDISENTLGVRLSRAREALYKLIERARKGSL
ncbi:MAG: RNA polymerase sigma factor [Candidatus Omnitrophica bacterium]|nr:RNA polymerase sigma factor [Candidatus Omnitrophota bacterium]